MNAEQRNILAEQMKGIGMEATATDAGVIVSLAARKLDTIEVKMALDQIFGHTGFKVTQTSNGVRIA